jgi:hypothetical protein
VAMNSWVQVQPLRSNAKNALRKKRNGNEGWKEQTYWFRCVPTYLLIRDSLSKYSIAA